MGNSLPCLASHEAKTFKKSKTRQNRRNIVNEEQILANLIRVQEKDDRHQGGEMKEVIRVKIVVTKNEAARLLSTFTIQDKDNSIVKTLAQIETRSRRVDSGQGSWRPMLESIPEIDIS